MKKNIIKVIKNAGALLTAMAGVLVLLYFAFFGAVMNDSFLAEVNLEIGTHEKLEMSEEDLIAVAESMVYYTKGETDTLQVKVNMGGVERDFYNERELLHIEDVRDLVREVRIFIIGCGIVFLTGTVALACSKDIIKLAKGFLISLGIVAALTAIVGVLALEDMSAVVKGFHYLFFDNDLWIMNIQRDMVVWLFSYDMYGSAIARIGIWLAAMLIPFTVLSAIAVKKERSSIEKEKLED